MTSHEVGRFFYEHLRDNYSLHELLLEEGNFWAPPDLERIEQHVAFNCTFDTSSINLVRIKLKHKAARVAHKKIMFGKEVTVKAKPAKTVVKAFPVAALKASI